MICPRFCASNRIVVMFLARSALITCSCVVVTDNTKEKQFLVFEFGVFALAFVYYFSVVCGQASSV